MLTDPLPLPVTDTVMLFVIEMEFVMEVVTERVPAPAAFLTRTRRRKVTRA